MQWLLIFLDNVNFDESIPFKYLFDSHDRRYEDNYGTEHSAYYSVNKYTTLFKSVYKRLSNDSDISPF